MHLSIPLKDTILETNSRKRLFVVVFDPRNCFGSTPRRIAQTKLETFLGDEFNLTNCSISAVLQSGNFTGQCKSNSLAKLHFFARRSVRRRSGKTFFRCDLEILGHSLTFLRNLRRYDFLMLRGHVTRLCLTRNHS